MTGDLTAGSPMADPASKETRSLPSSAVRLAPESKSPVLLFFGNLSMSKVSSDLSSFETTCRMPDPAVNDRDQSRIRLVLGKFQGRSAGSLLFPVERNGVDRRTIRVKFQLGHASLDRDATPLAQMVSERC